jgi:putrescine transport system substrate-binding protein
MRKWLAIFLTATCLSSLFFLIVDFNNDKLKICVFANWIPQDVIDGFEKETGISVVLCHCVDYDELEAKLLTGCCDYDLVFTCAWPHFVREVKIGLYQKIDIELLTNIKDIDSIVMKKLNLDNQKEIYCVPILWGTIGIAHNNQKLQNIDVSMSDLSVLFDIKALKKIAAAGEITILDSPMEILQLVMIHLGINYETCTVEDIQKAFNLLREIRPYISRFDSVRVRTGLASGNYVYSIALSDDILEIAQIKSFVQFSHMKEGNIVWLDVLAIPSTSKNAKLAAKFIDYLLKKNISADICDRTKSFSVLTSLLNDELKMVMLNGYNDSQKSPNVEKVIRRMWRALKAGYVYNTDKDLWNSSSCDVL